MKDKEVLQHFLTLSKTFNKEQTRQFIDILLGTMKGMPNLSVLQIAHYLLFENDMVSKLHDTNADIFYHGLKNIEKTDSEDTFEPSSNM